MRPSRRLAVCLAASVGCGLVACRGILGIDELPDPSDGGAPADASPLPDGAGASDGGTFASFVVGPDEKIFSLAPLPALTVAGSNNGLRFGEALAFSPSLDANNARWLAIGVPGAGFLHSGASPGRGAVQLVHLVPDPTTGSIEVASFLLDGSEDADDGSFGHAVAFSPDGRFLAVGAPTTEHAGSTLGTGAVHVFTLATTATATGTASAWTYAFSITNPADAPDLFGSSVTFALTLFNTVDVLLVGAPGTVTATSSGGGVAGAAYRYQFFASAGPDSGAPAVVAAVTRGQGDDGFGTSLASSANGDTIVIGAPYAHDEGSSVLYGNAWLASLDTFTTAGEGEWHYENEAPAPALAGYSVAVTADAKYAVVGGPGAGTPGECQFETVDQNPNATPAVPSFEGAGPELDPATPAADGGAFCSSVAVSAAGVFVGEPGYPDAGAVSLVPYKVAGTPAMPTVRSTTATVAGAALGTAVASTDDGFFRAASAPAPTLPSTSAAVYVYR